MPRDDVDRGIETTKIWILARARSSISQTAYVYTCRLRSFLAVPVSWVRDLLREKRLNPLVTKFKNLAKFHNLMVLYSQEFSSAPQFISIHVATTRFCKSAQPAISTDGPITATSNSWSSHRDHFFFGTLPCCFFFATRAMLTSNIEVRPTIITCVLHLSTVSEWFG